ncbi:MAG TPA: hypothetical protein VMZ05_06255 [Spirochaetota bacterium]|nr:hypothetical protein [Spirochaetota bacterium]
MIFLNLTALETGSKMIIVDLIKRVLENRYDIQPNEEFILNVADYTIERTQLTRLISENMILKNSSTDIREDYKLRKIIELLAIVNRAIDVVSLRDGSENILPG